MNTPDLFPAELAAAQRRTRTMNHISTNGITCTICGKSVDLDRNCDTAIDEQLPGHGPEASEPTPPEASESRELLSQDNKAEALERYWFWDDSDYARMVCQKRWGSL